MKLLKKIMIFIFNKEKRTIFLAQHGFYKNLSDEKFLKKQFKNVFKYKLDLENPKTYNEKLQWLKLYDRKDKYTNLVDKYKVKKIVSEIIGEEYIIPTLGVWKSFEEIDFTKLPNQFVLKCTHDSGGLVICTDKSNFNFKKARKKIRKSLKNNYYLQNREWPYKNVERQIIAEKYMVDELESELKDYKLMCFNGKVKCSFVCSNRNTESGLCVNFYDSKWEPMPFERRYQKNPIETKKPKEYNKMVELAEKLAQNIPFVRVDFYIIKNKIYFGELTFYPTSGFGIFNPVEWDYKLGEWLELPDKKM